MLSHLQAARDEYLPKHHAQGRGTGASQSICVQIFVVKQMNAKYLSTQMSVIAHVLYHFKSL